MDIFINKEVFSPESFSKKNEEILIGEDVYKLVRKSDHELIVSKNGKNLSVYYCYNSKNSQYLISLGGNVYSVKLGEGSHSELSAASSNVIISPMPGKIFKVLKNIGDKVSKGETVLILEAMKMEHSLKASLDGTIKTLKGSVGDQVSADQLLVELEESKT